MTTISYSNRTVASVRPRFAASFNATIATERPMDSVCANRKLFRTAYYRTRKNDSEIACRSIEPPRTLVHKSKNEDRREAATRKRDTPGGDARRSILTVCDATVAKSEERREGKS